MLDLDAVRAQFPALAASVYFDNAGGSQTLRAVAERISDYLLHSNVQLGASYAVSQTAGARVAAAVRATAGYLGAASEREVVIGPSTTQLLHNLALAMASQFRPGDEVVVTAADHEANVGPWKRLAARGVGVKVWPLRRETLRLEPEDLASLLGPRTRLVAFAHVSNLLGSIHDVTAITQLCHAHGAQVVVDGVAFAPHRLVEVGAWDVDYYVFSFYKVYGPHLAVLYGKQALLDRLDGINHDFIGNDAGPYKLQPGNLNFELTHGLGGLYDYVARLGGPAGFFADVAAHEERLVEPLLAYLRSRPDVTIWGEFVADRARRVPTVSFTVRDKAPEAIVRAVDTRGIGIRHGDFYAKGLVAALGLAERGGVVRVSMVHYNTSAEVARLIEALDAAM
jgi:cysteine desulfurase family protein (TIGR01976 family)